MLWLLSLMSGARRFMLGGPLGLIPSLLPVIAACGVTLYVSENGDGPFFGKLVALYQLQCPCGTIRAGTRQHVLYGRPSTILLRDGGHVYEIMAAQMRASISSLLRLLSCRHVNIKLCAPPSSSADVAAAAPSGPTAPHSDARRTAQLSWSGLIAVGMASLGCRRPSVAAVAWGWLLCYLAAWGAPAPWTPKKPSTWFCSLEATCRLQAWLHFFWQSQPLKAHLPPSLPPTYHAAWHQYLEWSGGVPQELLIATHCSGLANGSAAFAVWAFQRSRWYRVGWFASDLPSIAWSMGHDAVATHTSFLGEVVALQSAALWACAACDTWQLYMQSRPGRISVAVDNTSALQIAAGHAAAKAPAAEWCRACWQAVQARCNTTFRHVHSHMGCFVNTIADALADHASRVFHTTPVIYHASAALQTLIRQEGPWLWSLPQAQLVDGVPAYTVTIDSSLALP